MAGTIGSNRFRPTQEVVDEAVKNSQQGKAQTASSTGKKPEVDEMARLTSLAQQFNEDIRVLNNQKGPNAAKNIERLERARDFVNQQLGAVKIALEAEQKFNLTLSQNLLKTVTDTLPKTLVG